MVGRLACWGYSCYGAETRDGFPIQKPHQWVTNSELIAEQLTATLTPEQKLYTKKVEGSETKRSGEYCDGLASAIFDWTATRSSTPEPSALSQDHQDLCSALRPAGRRSWSVGEQPVRSREEVWEHLQKTPRHLWDRRALPQDSAACPMEADQGASSLDSKCPKISNRCAYDTSWLCNADDNQWLPPGTWRSWLSELPQTEIHWSCPCWHLLLWLLSWWWRDLPNDKSRWEGRQSHRRDHRHPLRRRPTYEPRDEILIGQTSLQSWPRSKARDHPNSCCCRQTRLQDLGRTWRPEMRFLHSPVQNSEAANLFHFSHC